MQAVVPRLALFTAGVWLIAALASAQVVRQEVPGIRNFAKIESTVACAGAITPAAIPDIKKMGFASIINLRVPTEQGANIDEEAAAAKETGIRFYSIPFNTASPDPAVPEKFLQTLTTPGNEPAYIHCASGNRAAAMWMIKRIAIDHWDTDRAATEAASLGLTNAALKQFALDYAQAHKR